MLDYRAKVGHIGRIISFEIWRFKEMQLLGRALYTGSRLLYAVLLNGPYLCAPGSGICCVLLDQIQQRNVFMWNVHCVYEYQPHTLEIWMAWEIHLLRRASGYGWLHKAGSRTNYFHLALLRKWAGLGSLGSKTHSIVYIPTSSHPHSHWDGECYNRRKSCFHVFLARIWSENLEFKWNLSQFPLCSFLSLTLGSLPWRTTFGITSRHSRCSSRMKAAFVGVKGGTY